MSRSMGAWCTSAAMSGRWRTCISPATSPPRCRASRPSAATWNSCGAAARGDEAVRSPSDRVCDQQHIGEWSPVAHGFGAAVEAALTQQLAPLLDAAAMQGEQAVTARQQNHLVDPLREAKARTYAGIADA